jgi:hypothetical protein
MRPPPSRWKRVILWFGLLSCANLLNFIFFERHFLDEYFWWRLFDGLLSVVIAAPILEPVRLPRCFEIVYSVLFNHSEFDPTIRCICSAVGYSLFAIHLALFVACKTYKTFFRLAVALVLVLALGIVAGPCCEFFGLRYESGISALPNPDGYLALRPG